MIIVANAWSLESAITVGAGARAEFRIATTESALG